MQKNFNYIKVTLSINECIQQHFNKILNKIESNIDLVQNEKELDASWFDAKALCGISAGASTPDWVVQNVIDKIQDMKIVEA